MPDMPLARALVGNIPAPTPPAAAEPEPEAPPPVEPAPVPEAPRAARYQQGARVMNQDGMRGVIEGEPLDDPFAYAMTMDDGTTRTETESMLEDDEMAENSPERTAPAAVAEELGLSAGVTTAACVSSIKSLQAALVEATATATKEASEALDAALASEGVIDNLKGMVASSLTRAEGESWLDAVKAHKGACPEAYAAVAVVEPVAVIEPVIEAPNVEAKPLPQGAAMPRRDKNLQGNAALTPSQHIQAGSTPATFFDSLNGGRR